jgi:hypothetical protein
MHTHRSAAILSTDLSGHFDEVKKLGALDNTDALDTESPKDRQFVVDMFSELARVFRRLVQTACF